VSLRKKRRKSAESCQRLCLGPSLSGVFSLRVGGSSRVAKESRLADGLGARGRERLRVGQLRLLGNFQETFGRSLLEILIDLNLMMIL